MFPRHPAWIQKTFLVLLELMRKVLLKLLPFWRDCFFRAFSSLWISGFAKDTCSVTLCVLTGHFTTDRLVIIKFEQHVDGFLRELASRTGTVVVSMEILYSKNPHRIVPATLPNIRQHYQILPKTTPILYFNTTTNPA